MKSFNTPIPKGKLKQFDEILKALGGRYLSNPVEQPDQYGHWRVSFEYDCIGAAVEHDRRWDRVTTEIFERQKKKQWWKRLTKFIRGTE